MVFLLFQLSQSNHTSYLKTFENTLIFLHCILKITLIQAFKRKHEIMTETFFLIHHFCTFSLNLNSTNCDHKHLQLLTEDLSNLLFFVFFLKTEHFRRYICICKCWFVEPFNVIEYRKNNESDLRKNIL